MTDNNTRFDQNIEANTIQEPTDTQGAIANEQPEEKKRKKRWIVLILLLLLLLTLGTCTAMKLMEDDTPPEDAAPVAVMPDIDGNVEDITTREELEGAMQDAADAAYFNLQVNPDASFSAGTGEGRFELINPGNNVYPISFVITRDDTGEQLYSSGTVPPNKQISTITLNNTPQPGSYSATVRVSIYNPDTHEKEGETHVKIEMSVTQ